MTRKLLVLANPEFVAIIRAGAPEGTTVIGPGGVTAGSHFRFVDDVIIQPGWKPSEQDRQWVHHMVITRFGPDDHEEAVEATYPYFPQSDEYADVFDEFWADIVRHPNGQLNVDQIKRELHDYQVLLGQVSRVYYHVTGGLISKPNTLADAVVCVADDHYARLCEEETPTAEVVELRPVPEVES